MNNREDSIQETLAEIDREAGIDSQDKRTPHPWAEVPIPQGYVLSDTGVSIEKDNPEPLTYSPCWVSAMSRDTKGNNWGRLVHWIDPDGRKHSEAISSETIHAQGNELAQHLASRGLVIAPGCERKLVRYLTVFQPKSRMISATATGWNDSAFVLPSNTINQPEGEQIILQAAGSSNENALSNAGSFDAWRELMIDIPPIVRFLVCASFSAPLRYLLNVESGGFHLCGATSKGKTTALQAAAGVWGNSVDPGIAGGDSAYIQRWNATANALEAMAAGFNDLPMIVDEIGEGESKEFGRTVYRIMSGSGRSRSRKDGSMAERRAWRVLLLSAGELPVDQYIAEGGGKAKGGQLIRLVDLPVDTVFDDAETADRIKHGCAKHYGHAGQMFVQWLAEHIEEAKNEWKEFDAALIGTAPTTESSRARKRFALAAFAGQLAARLNITPWSAPEILKTAQYAYKQWYSQSRSTDEGQRGIENIRTFIEANAARFETPNDVTPRQRAGWRRDELWHFTDQAFSEACNGANEKATKQALKRAKLLHTSHGFKSEIRVDRGTKVRVTSVRSDILSYPISNGDGGDTGGKPLKQRGCSRPQSKSSNGGDGDTHTASPTSATTAPVNKLDMGTTESHTNKGLPPPSPPSPDKNDKIASKEQNQDWRMEI